MVIFDVSVFVMKLLYKFYDCVIKVQYIKMRVKSVLWGKKYCKEDIWIEYSLIKVCMLKFIEYDKVIWLDVDLLVFNNIDEFFEF